MEWILQGEDTNFPATTAIQYSESYVTVIHSSPQQGLCQAAANLQIWKIATNGLHIHWKREGVVLQSGVRERDNSSMLWIVQTEQRNECWQTIVNTTNNVQVTELDWLNKH